MATRSTPRQIAAEVIQSLVELTLTVAPAAEIRERWVADGDRALYQHCRKVRDAILTRQPMPPAPDIPMPCPEWPAVEVAMQYASEAMVAAGLGDTEAAWRAAAEASYWHGAAEGLLRPEIVKQQVTAEARRRKADGRRAGSSTMRANKDARKRRAIELYAKLKALGPNPATGKPWTKDDAAGDILAALRGEFGARLRPATVRDYLRGV